MNQEPGAAELAGYVRAGSLTAAALVADALAAVDALDPVLHFISESWAGTALAAAGRIDALPPAERGALAGREQLHARGQREGALRADPFQRVLAVRRDAQGARAGVARVGPPAHVAAVF